MSMASIQSRKLRCTADVKMRLPATRAEMMDITRVATTRHLFPLRAPPMARPPEIKKRTAVHIPMHWCLTYSAGCVLLGKQLNRSWTEKCLKYQAYATFLKSWWLKDVKYDWAPNSNDDDVKSSLRHFSWKWGSQTVMANARLWVAIRDSHRKFPGAPWKCPFFTERARITGGERVTQRH